MKFGSVHNQKETSHSAIVFLSIRSETKKSSSMVHKTSSSGRMEKPQRSAVRGTVVSRHHGSLFEGPPHTPPTSLHYPIEESMGGP